jgi:uncharacterized membrane protein YuzA (DUF378 family)
MTNLKLYLFARLLLIIGGINYLIFAISKINLFSYLTENIEKTIHILIGLSAVILIFNRDYYLPFLGECAIPIINTTEDKSKRNLIKTTIKNLPPNVKLIYWAAKPGEIKNDPLLAYSDFSNSGIIITNDKGEAEIEYECPSEYKIKKSGKTLPKHIHFRYVNPKYPGLISRVYTKYLDEKCL